MKNSFLIFFIGTALICRAQSWHQIPSNTQSKLNSIDFPDSHTGYIAGNDSLILKTTNGGKTWAPLTLSGFVFTAFTNDLIHIDFIDEKNGYVVVGAGTSPGALYNTNDGGLNWATVNDVNICFTKTAHFSDSLNGIVAGSSCFAGETIQRLTSGAWQPVQIIGGFNSAFGINKIDFLNDTFGLAVGYSPHIFRTIDGGLNWDTVSYGPDTLTLTDVIVVDDTLAYATYEETGITGILISTDGGLSWDHDYSFQTFYFPGFNAIERTGNGHLVTGGKPNFGPEGMMFYERIPLWQFNLVDQHILDIATYGDSVIFAVGDSGYIIANIDPLIIGMDEVFNRLPARVYPNPAREVIFIENVDNNRMTIIFTDLSGRIIDQKTATGSRISLNCSGLSPGVYVVHCVNDHNVTSEKVILTGQ